MTQFSTVSKRMDSAKKRVAGLKDFHNHVIIYCIFNLILYVISGDLLQALTHGETKVPAGFLEWFNLNILITPILWGIGLLLHGLVAYRPKMRFIARWEARQIRKMMEEGHQAPDQN